MAPLAFVLLSSMTLTSYRSVPNQTDASPYITSIGHHVHPYGAAVSQDLLASGEVCYGDVLYIPGYGLRTVNDTMAKRHTRWIDLWVATYAEEKSVGVRRMTPTVWISPNRFCPKGGPK